MRWLAFIAITITGCQTLLFPVPREETVALAEDDLALAAKCLERGDDAGAVPHLTSLVKANPDQVMFRAQLAELLFQLQRDDDARQHFEQSIAASQDMAGTPRKHLVHCHTRLMELAERRDDSGEESFHKGVGLLLIAQQGEPDPEFRESVLCKALKALEEAKTLKLNNPRVLLYLGEAYAMMESPRAAARQWTAAAKACVPGSLTPAEERRLNSHREAGDP